MSLHQHPGRTLPLGLAATVVLSLLAAVLAATYSVARKSPSKPVRSKPALIRRGPHVSAALQPAALAGPPKKARPDRSGIVPCNRPGGTNHVANCKSQGRPAVEPWIVAHPPIVYAAAGDYNSWNDQAALGFYWSRDSRTWFDAGPLDLFPHEDVRSASGDPELAVDPDGVVYYSSVRFNFARCGVGGVELARRNPTTGAWRVTQIAANSKRALQDRPALAVDARYVYFAWTRFGSCTGEDGPSRLRVALLHTGSAAPPPTTILDVPGSGFSQGASIGADGGGGFWLAWEEYPDASAKDGSIELAHWSRSGGWSGPQTISPPGFRDLPDPLPGFHFMTDSAPALTVIGGEPRVAWASSDSGVGRVYLWSPGGARAVDDQGGDQLLPALSPDGHGGVAVSFSQVGRSRGAIVRVLTVQGNSRVVSSEPSYPNRDVFFSGRFIGDYAGMSLFGGSPLTVWTDLRVRPAAAAGAATAMTAR
jgi:hypothetical protein